MNSLIYFIFICIGVRDECPYSEEESPDDPRSLRTPLGIETEDSLSDSGFCSIFLRSKPRMLATAELTDLIIVLSEARNLSYGQFGKPAGALPFLYLLM